MLLSSIDAEFYVDSNDNNNLCLNNKLVSYCELYFCISNICFSPFFSISAPWIWCHLLCPWNPGFYRLYLFVTTRNVSDVIHTSPRVGCPGSFGIFQTPTDLWFYGQTWVLFEWHRWRSQLRPRDRLKHILDKYPDFIHITYLITFLSDFYILYEPWLYLLC